MSVRCVAWVLHESPTTGNDRLVLIAIADEADDDGRNGFPSFDLIAHKARVSRATVPRCVGRLEEGGELLVRRPEVKARGRVNRYVVVMGRDPFVLAAHVGWKAPELDPAVADQWCQSATEEPGSGAVDNSGETASNGPQRSHPAPLLVAPGDTGPLDPLTPRAKRALPGDKARAEADAMTRTQQAQRAIMDENAERLAAEEQVPLEDRKRLAAEVREATRQKLGR